jgi:hypothetical protein
VRRANTLQLSRDPCLNVHATVGSVQEAGVSTWQNALAENWDALRSVTDWRGILKCTITSRRSTPGHPVGRRRLVDLSLCPSGAIAESW